MSNTGKNPQTQTTNNDPPTAFTVRVRDPLSKVESDETLIGRNAARLAAAVRKHRANDAEA